MPVGKGFSSLLSDGFAVARSMSFGIHTNAEFENTTFYLNLLRLSVKHRTVSGVRIPRGEVWILRKFHPAN